MTIPKIGAQPDPVHQFLEAFADKLAERVAAKLAEFPKTVGDPLLSTKALAAHLGVRVEAITDMVTDGLPHLVVRSRRRYRVADVEAWLAERTPKASTAPKKVEPVDALESIGVRLVSGGGRR